jgi:hypothetical protein
VKYIQASAPGKKALFTKNVEIKPLFALPNH